MRRCTPRAQADASTSPEEAVSDTPTSRPSFAELASACASAADLLARHVPPTREDALLGTTLGDAATVFSETLPLVCVGVTAGVGALDDASSVVDKSEDEVYAYEAELTALRVANIALALHRN